MGAVDLKVGGVVFGTILVFTLVANAIPQVQSDVPELISFGAEVTAEELVAAGQNLFEGAGGCIACHSETPGGRGPNLLTSYEGEGTIGQRCTDRVSGVACKEYLYSALILPADYLVGEYAPIMPAVDRTMNQQQIWALVAFLESQGGEVTVTGADIQIDEPGGAEAGIAGAVGPALTTDDPSEILGQSCTLCHQLEGAGVELGPPLDGIGARLSAEEIRTAILDPGAAAPEGFEDFLGLMPATFGDQLSANQLESVITYLSALQ